MKITSLNVNKCTSSSDALDDVLAGDIDARDEAVGALDGLGEGQVEIFVIVGLQLHLRRNISIK